MERALLRDLGFERVRRADAGESGGGAWFATDADGTPVVLKWFPDEAVADRYEVLLPALNALRDRGVPVPDYIRVVAIDGWTLSAQLVMPGRPWKRSDGHGARPAPQHLVARVMECVAAAIGIDGPAPAPTFRPWGEFMIHTLTVGEDGYAMHAPLRLWSARSSALLDRIKAVGDETDAGRLPTTGLVHLDLHTGNVLADDDGVLTAIVDWESACVGDSRFDLAHFAFDLEGAGQHIWDQVDELVESSVLRPYVAHLALKFTDWAIRHHPDDVTRQLDRAERVLHQYGA